MLTKAIIKNFQSHKETTLDFVPGVNVIIGPSDAGKSAIFRAINWPITNRPLGDSFRSEWGGDTRVTLHTVEGDVVERGKGANKNEYILNGGVLKAFGSEVPEGITNILQLDSANIKTQTDPPFLLANTPGEAARLLNKAASIDDIDYAISNLKSSYTKIYNDIKFNEGKLQEYNEQIEQYKDIPVLEDKLTKVEQKEQERQDKERNKEQLKQVTSQVENVNSQLKETEQIPFLLKRYEQAKSKHDELYNKVERVNQLKQLGNRIGQVQEYLSSTQYVEKALSWVIQTTNKYQEWQDKSKETQALRQIKNQAEKKDKGIKGIDKEIKSLEQQFKELSPETCPLCGNEMEGGSK